MELMMTASLSINLPERIVFVYEPADGSYRDITRRFGASLSAVGKLASQFHTEKSLRPHTTRCGRRRCLSGADEAAPEN